MSRFLVGNSLSATLNSLYARSYIAGRDGTVTCTRATGRTNPATGTLLGNNVPATTQISLGGLPLTMYGCWGTRTNTCFNQTGNAGSDCTITINGTAFARSVYRLTEGTATTALHRRFSSSTVYVSGTTYTTTLFARQAVGSRQLLISHQAPDSWQTRINLTTGSNVNSTSGTGFVTSVSVVDSGSGWWKITMVGGPGANATSSGDFSWVLHTGSTNTYTGDGTSAIDVTDAQIETATFPGPYIPTSGSAVTHNSDLNVWTPPVTALASPFEITVIAAQYLWTAALRSQARAIGDNTGSPQTDLLLTAFGNEMYVGTVNAGGTYTKTDGSCELGSLKWDGTTATAYKNAVQVGTAPVPSITTHSTLGLGYQGSSAGPLTLYGFVAAIYTPGGLTTVERAALNSLKPSSISYVS